MSSTPRRWARALALTVVAALVTTVAPVAFSAAPAAAITSGPTPRTDFIAEGDRASISADGRYVAYTSDGHVFVYDRVNDVADEASVSTSGEPVDIIAWDPTISANGRYVAFVSNSTNLGTSSEWYQVYRHDRETGKTERVSENSGGGPINEHGGYPKLSADGRFVAYQTLSVNVPPHVESDHTFVRDMNSGGATIQVDASLPAGFIGNISADGNKVVFEVPGPHIYLWERGVGASEVVPDGADPDISVDGSTVAFTSYQPYDPADSDGSGDVYARNLSTGEYTWVSAPMNGAPNEAWATEATFSADGRHVAFTSSLDDLVPGDTSGMDDVFLKDLSSGAVERISVNSDGSEFRRGENNENPGGSMWPAVSADAGVVAFYRSDTTEAQNSGVFARVRSEDAGTRPARVIAAERDVNNTPTFHMLDAQGERLGDMPAGTTHASWSRDGKTYTWAVGNRAYVSGIGRVFNGDGGPVFYVTLSPDNAYLAVTTFSADLETVNPIIVPLNGGEPVEIHVLFPGLGVWSPDGTYWFSAAEGVFRLARGATEPELMLPGAGNPWLSPDGTRLATTARDGSGSFLGVYDVDDLAAAPVELGRGNFGWGTWSADGSRFTTNHRAPGANTPTLSVWTFTDEGVQRADLVNTWMRGTTQLAVATEPISWSPDGRNLLFSSAPARMPFVDPYALWQIPAGGGEPTPFYSPVVAENGSIGGVWSPPGGPVAPPPNQAPNMVWEVNPTSLQCVAPCTASVTPLATDPDGTVDLHQMDWGDNGPETGLPVSYGTIWPHSYTIPGTYTLTYTATDNSGSTSSVSTEIVVTAGSTPNLLWQMSPVTGTAPHTVTFIPQATDPEGADTISHQIDWGDDTPIQVVFYGIPVTHRYIQAGTYHYRYIVQDDAGNVATSASEPIVVDAGSPPNLLWQMSPVTGTAPHTVTFIAQATDPEGGNLSHQIDWGDGELQIVHYGIPVTHRYVEAGTYHYRYIVQDDAGNVATSASEPIVVDADELPTMDWLVTPAPVDGVATCELPCPVTVLPLATDPDGIANHHIDWGAGQGGANVPPGLGAGHAYNTAGTRTVTYTATDNTGSSATLTFELVVEPNRPPTLDATVTPTPVDMADPEPDAITCTAPCDVTVTPLATDKDGVDRHQIVWDYPIQEQGFYGIPITHTYQSAGTYDLDYAARDIYFAGQTRTLATVIVLEGTPPETTMSASGLAGITGWRRQASTLTFTATDNGAVSQIFYEFTGAQSGSGVINGVSGTAVVSAQGETTVRYHAVDASGNVEAEKTALIKIDSTPPSQNCAAAPAGWSASDVSITCTLSDPLSGVSGASSITTSTNVAAGTETDTARTGVVQACDFALNCGFVGNAGPVKIDKKGPVVTITTPAQGASYIQNSAVTAAYACVDGGSGSGSCTGPVVSGAAVPTGTTGAASFAVAATDAVGNAAAATSSYSIVPPPPTWGVVRVEMQRLPYVSQWCATLRTPAGVVLSTRCMSTAAGTGTINIDLPSPAAGGAAIVSVTAQATGGHTVTAIDKATTAPGSTVRYDTRTGAGATGGLTATRTIQITTRESAPAGQTGPAIGGGVCYSVQRGTTYTAGTACQNEVAPLALTYTLDGNATPTTDYTLRQTHPPNGYQPSTGTRSLTPTSTTTFTYTNTRSTGWGVVRVEMQRLPYVSQWCATLRTPAGAILGTRCMSGTAGGSTTVNIDVPSPPAVGAAIVSVTAQTTAGHTVTAIDKTTTAPGGTVRYDTRTGTGTIGGLTATRTIQITTRELLPSGQNGPAIGGGVCYSVQRGTYTAGTACQNEAAPLTLTYTLDGNATPTTDYTLRQTTPPAGYQPSTGTRSLTVDSTTTFTYTNTRSTGWGVVRVEMQRLPYVSQWCATLRTPAGAVLGTRCMSGTAGGSTTVNIDVPSPAAVGAAIVSVTAQTTAGHTVTAIDKTTTAPGGTVRYDTRTNDPTRGGLTATRTIQITTRDSLESPRLPIGPIGGGVCYSVQRGSYTAGTACQNEAAPLTLTYTLDGNATPTTDYTLRQTTPPVGYQPSTGTRILTVDSTTTFTYTNTRA